MVNCILSENICRNINHRSPQELITQHEWNRPAAAKTKTKKLSQSVEYSMHHINCAKREQEKPLLTQLFKPTIRSRFTISCRKLLVVFNLSTLNSNQTNHTLRKKLANQKRRHMSLRLCGIRTRYCALIRRRSRAF